MPQRTTQASSLWKDQDEIEYRTQLCGREAKSLTIHTFNEISILRIDNGRESLKPVWLSWVSGEPGPAKPAMAIIWLHVAP